MTNNQSTVQLATLLFIIGITLIVIAYDVAIYRAWGQEPTISRMFQRIFRWLPILQPIMWFSFGVFVGHVFLHSE